MITVQLPKYQIEIIFMDTEILCIKAANDYILEDGFLKVTKDLKTYFYNLTTISSIYVEVTL